MITNGTRPEKRDHRKYSYHRTFGAITSPLASVPDEFDFDAGLTMPDQYAEGFPMGCTSYTTTEICQDEDGIVYQKKFTYDNTLMIEGIGPADPEFEKVGCLVTDSLKSAVVYGLDDGRGTDPLLKRRSAYYDVLDNPYGLDAFDAIRLAMWSAYQATGKKKTVSVGTPWLPEWSRGSSSGIVTSVVIYSGKPADYPWHNWKISGFKRINGVLYAKGKTWQGKRVGDGGWLYYSRETIDKVFAISGTTANMLLPYSAATVQTVKKTVLETLITYMQRLISKLQNTMPTTPTKTPMIDTFCGAIRDFEGSPGDRNYQNNNPGNCRCSPVGYLPKYGKVLCVDGFAKFPTYELGWEYLEALVMSRAEAHPDWTILEFFTNYAPPADNNPTAAYANFVAARCGVPATTKLSQLFG